jgi:hypothetical protein
LFAFVGMIAGTLLCTAIFVLNGEAPPFQPLLWSGLAGLAGALVFRLVMPPITNRD